MWHHSKQSQILCSDSHLTKSTKIVNDRLFKVVNSQNAIFCLKNRQNDKKSSDLTTLIVFTILIQHLESDPRESVPKGKT